MLLVMVFGAGYAMADLIYGTSGDDDLAGTHGPDTIYGKEGNDILRGRGGDDVLRGGYGNDTIYGRDGNDTIYGGTGDDTIKGGPGDDTIDGKDGYDTCLYNGSSADYQWQSMGGGWWSITGPDGTDALLNVEHIAFDDIQGIDLPVPVTLSSFTAMIDDGMITLRWSTGSESENLGYHIYRSLTADGAYEKLTSALIEGAGSSRTTRTYEFVDGDVQSGQTYMYKLEQINFDGTKETYELVVLGSTTAVQSNTWGAIKSLLK
jgi:Ca2+-binding RTX toxin-like protein